MLVVLCILKLVQGLILALQLVCWEDIKAIQELNIGKMQKTFSSSYQEQKSTCSYIKELINAKTCTRPDISFAAGMLEDIKAIKELNIGKMKKKFLGIYIEQRTTCSHIEDLTTLKLLGT